jgi:hypothetical protein
LYTLHRPNGTLIEDTFWLEPQMLKSSWIYRADEQWSRLQKGATRSLSKLQSIKYRSEVETALVRYTRALDRPDHGASFSRIWGVLEYLTNSIGEYDKLISRVSFLISDSDRRFICLLLQHLRDVRNGLVHADEACSNVGAYLYQLKWITEILIRFHLRNGNRFSSRARAAEYLDTPVDRTILEQRVRDYRRALRERV